MTNFGRARPVPEILAEATRKLDGSAPRPGWVTTTTEPRQWELDWALGVHQRVLWDAGFDLARAAAVLGTPKLIPALERLRERYFAARLHMPVHPGTTVVWSGAMYSAANFAALVRLLLTRIPADGEDDSGCGSGAARSISIDQLKAAFLAFVVSTERSRRSNDPGNRSNARKADIADQFENMRSLELGGARSFQGAEVWIDRTHGLDYRRAAKGKGLWVVRPVEAELTRLRMVLTGIRTTLLENPDEAASSASSRARAQRLACLREVHEYHRLTGHAVPPAMIDGVLGDRLVWSGRRADAGNYHRLCCLLFALTTPALNAQTVSQAAPERTTSIGELETLLLAFGVVDPGRDGGARDDEVPSLDQMDLAGDFAALRAEVLAPPRNLDGVEIWIDGRNRWEFRSADGSEWTIRSVSESRMTTIDPLLDRLLWVRARAAAWGPNALTLSRLFMLPAIVYFVLTERMAWAYAFYLIGNLTDVLDGSLARALHTTSDLGARLDRGVDVVFNGITGAAILVAAQRRHDVIPMVVVASLAMVLPVSQFLFVSTGTIAACVRSVFFRVVLATLMIARVPGLDAKLALALVGVLELVLGSVYELNVKIHDIDQGRRGLWSNGESRESIRPKVLVAERIESLRGWLAARMRR